MLAAYLDESGTHVESPVLAVAGFLAPQGHWLEYESKWSGVLEKWGLSTFHMVEYENRQGPYAQFSNEQRKELLASLIDIIRATVWVGVAAAVVKKDYDAICQAERITFGSPYSLCANECIRLLKRWMDAQRVPERITFMFELGAQGAADIHGAFGAAHAIDPDRYHLQGLHFVSKSQYSQLQAADILAYETPKQAIRTLGLDPRELRKSLDRLLRGVPVENSLLDAHSLPDYVAKSREWLRGHGQEG